MTLLLGVGRFQKRPTPMPRVSYFLLRFETSLHCVKSFFTFVNIAFRWCKSFCPLKSGRYDCILGVGRFQKRPTPLPKVTLRNIITLCEKSFFIFVNTAFRWCKSFCPLKSGRYDWLLGVGRFQKRPMPLPKVTLRNIITLCKKFLYIGKHRL